MILTIRTDKPESEVGLYNKDGKQEAYKKWHAHRELSGTIHKSIKELLDQVEKDWLDISAIIFFSGPGSFTGLRIGASVANALAMANQIPLTQTTGQNWIEKGLKILVTGNSSAGKTLANPDYGAPPNITKPVK